MKCWFLFVAILVLLKSKGRESIRIVHTLMDCECSVYIRVMDSQATNGLLVAFEFHFGLAFSVLKAETKHSIVGICWTAGNSFTFARWTVQLQESFLSRVLCSAKFLFFLRAKTEHSIVRICWTTGTSFTLACRTLKLRNGFLSHLSFIICRVSPFREQRP